MHHEKFQKLEGSWRGMHHMVNFSETGRMLKIRMAVVPGVLQDTPCLLVCVAELIIAALCLAAFRRRLWEPAAGHSPPQPAR